MELERNLLNPHNKHLNINTPLKDVVVQSSDVTQAAAKIFKEHYKNLVSHTEEMKKKSFYCEAAYSASVMVGTVFAGAGGFMFSSYPLILTLGLIGGGISGVLVTGGISAFLDVSLSKKIEKNKYVLTMCDAIYEFSRALKSFKENPLEDNVHALFTDLDNLIFLFSESDKEIEEEENLREKYDFWIFSPIAKLFLMEEVMTILHAKPNENLDQFFEKFNIESPDDQTIADFATRKKAVLKPFKIKTQMVTIFNHILQDHIDR